MIAIVGGSGFIGTRLCRRLTNSSKDFQIIDKSPSDSFPLKVLPADIRYPISIAVASGTTALINLAAEHRDNVMPITLYDEVNVQGAVNVCNFAEQNGINKIIFTSSVAVYGFAPVGTDELGTINPFNPYGKTKWAAEEVYSAWQAMDPKSRTL
jgi:nucleoside-diphosphate-sugar epimerase